MKNGVTQDQERRYEDRVLCNDKKDEHGYFFENSKLLLLGTFSLGRAGNNEIPD